MHGSASKNVRRDYSLYFRKGEVAYVVPLRDVEPERLEVAVSSWLSEWGASAQTTRILRVESSQARTSFPSSATGDRWLDVIARMLRVRGDDLADALAGAWAAAAHAYRARVGVRGGRGYALHSFDGPLRVQAGSISGELTCLHPALTSPVRDVYPVIGEARLEIGKTSLVLEFDGEIDGAVANGWQHVSVAVAGPWVSDDFPDAGWFVVE